MRNIWKGNMYTENIFANASLYCLFINIFQNLFKYIDAMKVYCGLFHLVLYFIYWTLFAIYWEHPYQHGQYIVKVSYWLSIILNIYSSTVFVNWNTVVKNSFHKKYFTKYRIPHSKMKACYTLFANNDEKRMNRRNSCETQIVCRELFIVIREHFAKNFCAKCICRSRRSFDKHKELFLPYLRVFPAATRIRENCCLWRIMCRPLLVTFRETQFFFHKKVVSSSRDE